MNKSESVSLTLGRTFQNEMNGCKKASKYSYLTFVPTYVDLAKDDLVESLFALICISTTNTSLNSSAFATRTNNTRNDSRFFEVKYESCH